ncbi:Redoxin [Chytriomyces sp. MP71]|nr:Redoxin [Chytriomyces sp. MP71]
MAPIQVGDKIPAGLTFVATTNAGDVNACAIPKQLKSEDVLGSGKIILFAVPGAFTPTCHLQHLPGYVKHADAFKAKGVSNIYVTSTNDVFVLDAWAKHEKADGKVSVLADGNGEFAKAAGMHLDLSGNKMGANRTKRYALIIENGVVTYVGEGDLDMSGAEAVLAKL